MNGWVRKAFVTALLAVAAWVGGWYGKVVWSHESRITKAETRLEGVHETLNYMKNTLLRIDKRTERLWERAR